jgi:predicted nucleic acid-binding Zn ribbon protein
MRERRLRFREAPMLRIDQPDPGPEPLREILARLFTARGWGRRQARLHLERAWEAAVGPDFAPHTRVLGLRRGVFEVEVNGATLLQELAHFHKRRLLQALRDRLPAQPPRELRFRAGSWEGPE